MESDRPPHRAIAVTGGLGTGKSRVARWLAQKCHYPLYDADSEVKSLLFPGEAGWQRLRACLSVDYFAPDGVLLKGKLRQAIFSDTALRQEVERALHPLVLARLQEKMALCHGSCLVEVPLLYEVGWQGYFDTVLVVFAQDEICSRRVSQRDHVSVEEAIAAIGVQMPILEKVALADYTVDNSGAWSDTLLQLEKISESWSLDAGKKA